MSISELSFFSHSLDKLKKPSSWPIDDFCTLVFSEMKGLKDDTSVRVVEIRHYKEIDGLEHEFLLVGVEYREKHLILRIERSTPARMRRTFWQKLKQTSSSILPALDTVSISSSFKKLTEDTNRGPIIHVATLPISSGIITLHEFCLLLSLFPSLSPIYKLKEEQCYWFCNVILATVSSMRNATPIPGEGFKRAGKYGRVSVNVSAKARQRFIDGYRIIHRLQDKSSDQGPPVDLTAGTAQALVAMLAVQSDEAKHHALTSIISLASHSIDSRQMLLEASPEEPLCSIFISFPVELKVLIFLALDALGISDFDPLSYAGQSDMAGNLEIEDTFTKEDARTMDSHYKKALLDLLDLLDDIRPSVCSWSARMVGKFAWHDKYRPSVRDAIPRMATSPVRQVRLTSIRIITRLARYSDMCVSLPEIMAQIFPALLNEARSSVRVASIAGLRRLADRDELREQSVMIFPLVAFLFLENSDSMVSKIEGLHSDSSIAPVEMAIAYELCNSEFDYPYLVGLRAISAAVKYPVCHATIAKILPRADILLTDESREIRQATVDLLSDLISISRFRPYIEEATPKVLGLFKHGNSSVRSSAVEFALKAASDPDLYSFIVKAFPRVVGLLTDTSWHIRQSAVNLLSDIISKSEFRPHVEGVVSNMLGLLQDDSNDVRQSTVQFLTKAAQNNNFHSAILGSFPRIVGLLTNDSWGVRRAAVILMSNLIHNAEFRPSVEEAMPQVLRLLRDNDRDVQEAVIDFLEQAIRYFNHHPAIAGIVPQLVYLLSDVHWLFDVSRKAANLLCNFLAYANLRFLLRDIIPRVRELQYSESPSVVQAVRQVLEKASDYGIH